MAHWQKQQARDQKKAAASVKAKEVKPQPQPATKPETPAVRKQREARALEAQLA